MARRLDVLERIRREIAAQGLTAYRLAQMSGITATTIQRFINRENDLGGPSVDAVCRALGLVLVHSDELKEARRG